MAGESRNQDRQTVAKFADDARDLARLYARVREIADRHRRKDADLVAALVESLNECDPADNIAPLCGQLLLLMTVTS